MENFMYNQNYLGLLRRNSIHVCVWALVLPYTLSIFSANSTPLSPIPLAKDLTNTLCALPEPTPNNIRKITISQSSSSSHNFAQALPVLHSSIEYEITKAITGQNYIAGYYRTILKPDLTPKTLFVCRSKDRNDWEVFVKEQAPDALQIQINPQGSLVIQGQKNRQENRTITLPQ